MKLGLFGGGRLGLVDGTQVRDVTALAEAATGVTGATAGAAGERGLLDAVIRSGAFAPSAIELAGLPAQPLAEVRWEAPLPRPGKVIGAPANYYEHIAEMTGSKSILEYGVFLKASTSVIGPGETIELPYTDVRTDHEGELAVVIGTGGRDIPLEEALDHVYGYSCVLDITVRSTEDRSTRKSYDTFTPLGPWIVTADEIDEVGALELTLDVNGDERQRTTTAKLIYGVPELIAYASSVMTLEPGDVIATGTPAGVGPIIDGDVVTVTVEGVGALTVDVSGRRAVEYTSRPGPASALVR